MCVLSVVRKLRFAFLLDPWACLTVSCSCWDPGRRIYPGYQAARWRSSLANLATSPYPPPTVSTHGQLSIFLKMIFRTIYKCLHPIIFYTHKRSANSKDANGIERQTLKSMTYLMYRLNGPNLTNSCYSQKVKVVKLQIAYNGHKCSTCLNCNPNSHSE